jgi:predicted MFS family arabinose efflux permease
MARQIFTRDFILISSAQLVFTAVFFALMPTIPIYLSRQGIREAEIGVLVGVFIVASLVIKPFVGRALLRIPERKFLIAGSLVTAVCCMGYLVAPPFFPLFILRTIQGIGFAFFITASFTSVFNMTPSAHHGEAISYFYVASNVATALAPAVGMLLINQFGFTVLFLGCAAFSLFSFCVSFRLKKSYGAPTELSPSKKQSFLNREALPLGIMGLISNNIWGAMNAFFPLFAVSHGVANPGIMFTVFAAVLMLGRGFGGKILDTYPKDKIMVPCLIAQVIAMTTLAHSTTLPMFLVVAVIWGMGNAFLYPVMMASAIERAGGSRGPAIATYTAFTDLGTGMGAVFMGVVVEWTSYRTMFLCLACMSLVNLLYLNLFVKKKGVTSYAHL